MNATVQSHNPITYLQRGHRLIWSYLRIMIHRCPFVITHKPVQQPPQKKSLHDMFERYHSLSDVTLQSIENYVKIKAKYVKMTHLVSGCDATISKIMSINYHRYTNYTIVVPYFLFFICPPLASVAINWTNNHKLRELTSENSSPPHTHLMKHVLHFLQLCFSMSTHTFF